jgi:hypothetical protein
LPALGAPAEIDNARAPGRPVVRRHLDARSPTHRNLFNQAMTNPFEPPRAESQASEPAAVTVALLFSSIPGSIGPWYPPLLGFSAVVGLACMVGLWRMKKWAVYTYTAFALCNQVVLLVMGIWGATALVIPALVIAFMWANVAKMS